MKAVVLGGTRGMGRALARKLVEAGHDVFLLGRDTEQLLRSVRDLGIRSDRPEPGFALCDLERPETFAAALASAWEFFEGFDTVVVTAGVFGTQQQLEGDLRLLRRMLEVNFANTILFCERARVLLMARGTPGTLCVFSSVAGERGRKPVVLYGASKAGLSAYLEGLDHRYRGDGLRVVCIKPGFVRTGMTDGLAEPPFAADAAQVAGQAIRAMQRGTPVRFAPGIWGLIMWVIRRLPRSLMRRLSF